jgi:general secretion pathway protein D
VSISDVQSLYAYQFDVSFDPGVLHLESISEGDFLRGNGSSSTLFVPGTIDNIAGRATLTAGTLVGALPGVSGTGVLAQLQFDRLSSGPSPLVLSNVVLLDSELNEIVAMINNGLVSAPVPEPGTLSLMISAPLVTFVLLGCSGKRRR